MKLNSEKKIMKNINCYKCSNYIFRRNPTSIICKLVKAEPLKPLTVMRIEPPTLEAS